MARTILNATLGLICLATTLTAAAQVTQTPTSQAPTAPTTQSPRIQNFDEQKEPNPPDIVCFGYGPKWSVQFVNGEARYLGINQPDQYFLGDFFWVEAEKAWEWHRADGLAPMNGSFALSATIQKQECKDPVRKETYPYSSQINLPQGDMVSGCCRKLKPGEAPVGKHGMERTVPTPEVPAPTGSTTTQQQSSSPKTPAGQPVSQ